MSSSIGDPPPIRPRILRIVDAELVGLEELELELGRIRELLLEYLISAGDPDESRVERALEAIDELRIRLAQTRR